MARHSAPHDWLDDLNVEIGMLEGWSQTLMALGRTDAVIEPNSVHVIGHALFALASMMRREHDAVAARRGYAQDDRLPH